MGTEADALGVALTGARRVRLWNAVTAVVCGFLPSLVLIRPFSAHRLLVGFLIGLIWSNGFEYAYHRWILHWPKGGLGKGHLLHHATLGTPYEPEHVTFGSSPFAVAVIFIVNGLPVVLLDRALQVRVAAGMLIGFAVYFIMTEEVHWRIHLGGCLPSWLSPAREYHLAHHDRPDARFNVFLPLFDLVLGNLTTAESSVVTKPERVARRVSDFYRQAAEGILVYSYLIAISIFFWCSFRAATRRGDKLRNLG